MPKSQRLGLYQQYADQLVRDGKAYRCFCSAQSLDDTKLQTLETGGAGHYPGTCRSVGRDESDERAANGEAHVIRFKVDNSTLRASFVDIVYGRFQKREDEDDFILIKSDGFPTYHFANVVDDHLMDITHVIRGAVGCVDASEKPARLSVARNGLFRRLNILRSTTPLDGSHPNTRMRLCFPIRTAQSLAKGTAR